jgi:hypothetical protein
MIREKLEEKFFEHLEEEGIEFNEYETLPNGDITSYVKDEYLRISVEDMCDYLGMDDWVKQWTIDLIEEEESRMIDTDTEYGMVRPSKNTKESEVL